MNWTSLAAHFRKWRTEMMQTIETTESRPNPENAPEWYAGLVVSPAAFSQQLGDLQISLQRANQPSTPATEAQEVPVRVRRTA
jgi:hypothetical protein